MDAIIFLKNEHSKVKATIKTIASLKNDKVKQTKFNALCDELVVHETMEEKVWYPALRKYKTLTKIIKHLIGEEKAAAKAIKTFKQSDMGVMWKLRFAKFKHDVLHHAKEEETELFPKARKLLTKAELEELGTKMRKFKAAAKK